MCWWSDCITWLFLKKSLVRGTKLLHWPKSIKIQNWVQKDTQPSIMLKKKKKKKSDCGSVRSVEKIEDMWKQPTSATTWNKKAILAKATPVLNFNVLAEIWQVAQTQERMAWKAGRKREHSKKRRQSEHEHRDQEENGKLRALHWSIKWWKTGSWASK